MERKVKLTSVDGTVKEGKVIIRDKDHFEAQQKFPSRSIPPKKGKGSTYSRKEKHKGKEM
jgi:stalled ribosome alternative rescue factor ArfA